VSSSLSGHSNYPTQFATLNLQITKNTQFVSPSLPPEIFKLPNYPICVSQFEWAFQLLDLICHLKSPNRQIYLIFVTRFESAFQFPNPVCHLTSPNRQNYPIFVIQFAT